jgi:heptosyltransferase-2
VREKLSNVLVARTDRLGDVILTLPVFAALREFFPQARLSFLLQSYTAELIEGHPLVDEVIRCDVLPRSELLRLVRSKMFDAAIAAYPTWSVAWLLFRARIPIRVGSGYRPYSLLFTHRRYEHRHLALQHESEYNLNLLCALGVDPLAIGPPQVSLPISATLRRESLEIAAHAGVDFSKPVVVIHPGSGGSAWDWPLERFAELGKLLRAGHDVTIVITGSESEQSIAEHLVQMIGGSAFSLAGKFTLKQLTAFLSNASVVVANSTGPIHIAAAVGTAVVGLYPNVPPMTPRRWSPLTEKKQILVPHNDKISIRATPHEQMMSISAEEVFRAVELFLPRENYPSPESRGE